MRGMNINYVIEIISVRRRWELVIQEYLINIYKGVLVFLEFQLLSSDVWIYFILYWFLYFNLFKFSSEVCLKIKYFMIEIFWGKFLFCYLVFCFQYLKRFESFYILNF